MLYTRTARPCCRLHQFGVLDSSRRPQKCFAIPLFFAALGVHSPARLLAAKRRTAPIKHFFIDGGGILGKVYPTTAGVLWLPPSATKSQTVLIPFGSGIFKETAESFLRGHRRTHARLGRQPVPTINLNDFQLLLTHPLRGSSRRRQKTSLFGRNSVSLQRQRTAGAIESLHVCMCVPAVEIHLKFKTEIRNPSGALSRNIKYLPTNVCVRIEQQRDGRILVLLRATLYIYEKGEILHLE